MTREDHILSMPWRQGDAGGSIVCDNPKDTTIAEDEGTLKFYGGFPVAESMPRRVAEHIIAMHNAALMDTKKMRCVWAEDDATTHDPDHECVDAAYRRLFGEDFSHEAAVLKCDEGDGNLYRMPNGVAVWASYPGGSAIYVDR